MYITQNDNIYMAVLDKFLGLNFEVPGKTPSEAVTGLAGRLVGYLPDNYMCISSEERDAIRKGRLDLIKDSLIAKFGRAVDDGYRVCFSIYDKNRHWDLGMLYDGYNMGDIIRSAMESPRRFIRSISVGKRRGGDGYYAMRVAIDSDDRMYDTLGLEIQTVDGLYISTAGHDRCELNNKVRERLLTYLVDNYLRVGRD